MSTALGNHILVEFMNCDPHIMNDVAAIEKDMVTAAQKAGATVINSTFHHFSPYGVSGVVVIQYPTLYPTAPAFPGACDCSPSTPGSRTYKFNGPGSITLP